MTVIRTLLGEWNGQEWRPRAACRHSCPDLFFPVGETGPAAIDDIEAAKSVCRGCAVRAECLDFAMVTHQPAGVWGGATEEERRMLRRADVEEFLKSLLR